MLCVYLILNVDMKYIDRSMFILQMDQIDIFDIK